MSDPMSITSGTGVAAVPLVNPVNPQVQAEVVRRQPVVDSNGTGRDSAQPRTITRNDVLTRMDGLSRPDATDATGKTVTDRPGMKGMTLDEAEKTFREHLDSLPSDLSFHVDKDADKYVFKIVNPSTREVVRQFPPDEFLHMVKKLKELSPNNNDNGIFLDGRF